MNATMLQGVRIIEVGHALTEHAGRLFASLGAEVLLIEPPAGTDARRRSPRVSNDDATDRSSVPFLARNINKHSVTIDHESADQRSLLASLIERSHLVLDADRSLFFDLTQSARGDAARVTITDEFGLGASSIVGFAASGGMACSGWPDKAPVNAPSWLAPDAASIYAATMGAVALFVQNRHGVRLDYEIPYHEAAVRCIAPWSRHLHAAGINVAGQGVNPGRSGAGPYPVIRTADGWIKLVIATPRQFEALVTLMGEPDEFMTGIWSDSAFARENIEACFLACEEYLRDRPTAELFEQGQKLGLTISPLNTMQQFRADTHAQERDLFVTLDDPDWGSIDVARAPTVTEPAALMVEPEPAPGLGSGNARAAEIVTEEPFSLRPSGNVVDPLRPLADLRLLQLGSGAVVPEACSDFALLGADIVRVESLVNPDFLRRGGLDGDLDCSATFNQLNLGVRSLAIDMRQADATTIVQTILENSDAVVENMRAPVVQNWGFGYESCRAQQSNVVFLSSQGFGRGPYGEYQSFGPNLSAYCGVASQWAHADDPVPVGASIPHPDHVAGKQAFVALLAALRRRDRTGEGCMVEAAQVEAPAHLIADRFTAQGLRQEDIPPIGNRSEDFAPYGCYPCTDGEWLAIAVESDSQWTALAEVVGQEWASDAKLGNTDVRRWMTAALDIALADWTKDWDVAALESALRSAGVPRVTGGERRPHGRRSG